MSTNESSAGEPQPLRPIFMATLPRSCSTAFERVMMTRSDALVCEHEPFGDAFYYGPERLAARYDGDSASARAARAASGFESVTYADVVDKLEQLERRGAESGKRLFIKDISCYLVPPPTHPAAATVPTAPSLRLGLHKRKGYGTPSSGSDTESATSYTDGTGSPEPASYGTDAGVASEDLAVRNPTVLPLAVLRRFHFTFLIRHPRRAVPSYYRCCRPPLSAKTGFDYFRPDEAGYYELRTLFDFLRAQGLVGGASGVEVFVLDADDLLDSPAASIRRYCDSVGIDFTDDMLKWGEGGCEAFDKWKGFHEDAIGSTELRPRATKVEKSEAEEYAEWVEKYGTEGADVIRDTVAANLPDYEYLMQFKVHI